MENNDCFECGEEIVFKVRPSWDVKWGEIPLTLKEVELWECTKCEDGGVFTHTQSREVDRKIQEALKALKDS